MHFKPGAHLLLNRRANGQQECGAIVGVPAEESEAAEIAPARRELQAPEVVAQLVRNAAAV